MIKMSFQTNQSLDPLRRELEQVWRRRLENAFERYRAAADEYGKLLQGGPAESRPLELNRIIRAEAAALEEHSRVLRIFTDLVLDGELPEEAEGALISVVDDDESIRDSAQMLLRSVGYRVATFASGESFLESKELAGTECLILDIEMPGMKGLELQKRLNSNQACIPIVFLTARDDLKNRRLAMEAGAAGFLGKPFEAENLVLAVRATLARSRAPAWDRHAVAMTGGKKLEGGWRKREQGAWAMPQQQRSGPKETAPVEGLSCEVDRVADQNEGLERTIATLMRSNQDLERFVWVVSHDLQEPIRATAAYAQILADKYSSHLDDDARSLIGNIVKGSARMRELLSKLLAHAAAGHRPPGSPEAVDLNEVLEIVKANLEASIAECNAAVTSGPLPVLRVYSSDFIPLFQNLIANAIKYRSDRPPHVHVSARVGSGQTLFSVSDNGIGIDPKYHEQIFEPFRRLHGSAIPGTGLGLAICRRVIERYEGRIWVESQPGQGATFLFTLSDSEIESC
jgi:signal transduction histidine kinase